MKSLSIHISIPKPCHEQWDGMTTTERGAFCQSCQTEVIDFSAMTDREVIEYLSKNKAGCGRFRNDQLNTNLSIASVENGVFKWRALFFGFLSFISFKNVNASSVYTLDTFSHTNKKTVSDTTLTMPSNDSIQINGKVLDEKGEPMIGATIILVGTGSNNNIGTATDLNGNFLLELDRNIVKHSSHQIEVRFVGFLSKFVSITNESNQLYTVKYDEKDVRIMGGMEPIIIHNHYIPSQKIRYWFRHAFRIRPHKRNTSVTGRF